MKYKELPENLQAQIDELKYYSQSIQSDVMDSLESADNLEDFRLKVRNSMNDIISEAKKVCDILGKGEV